MSRKAVIVEEFDDDTDLPLPSIPLLNAGMRGPILQEINDESDDDDDFEPTHQAGPASPPRQPFSNSQQQWFPPDADGSHRVTDIAPYKSWTCIYPIYLDAKRPYGTGQRRVARGKSLWWPLSSDIAEATTRLGLGTLHEVNKAHPRDWENPGRVRVQWKKDGKFINPIIKTKKQLLEMICYQVQVLKPENIPKPPYSLGNLPIPAPLSQKPVETSQLPATSAPTSASTPSKQKDRSVPKSKSAAASHPQLGHKGDVSSRQPTAAKLCLPIPPEPYPALSSRLSVYSPAISSGVLIETIKAGMNAQADAGPAVGSGSGGMGGIGKGKRKLVRVRQ